MRRLFILAIIIFWGNNLLAQGINFQWAKVLQFATTGAGHFINIDAAGNVYTAGSFYDNPDFDPGPGVYNLTTNGQDDGFITKYDPNGNFVWAKNIGGAKQDYIQGLATDASGNVYVTGYFTETADFDPGPGVFNLSCSDLYPDVDIFICKLNNNGDFVWAKQIGGTGIQLNMPRSISLDNQGNIYTTGNFEGMIDFDPGPSTFFLGPGPVGTNIYVSKLDNNGNFVWAKALMSTSTGYLAYSNCITTDAIGNCYITGNFEGTLDFDPGPAVYNLNTPIGNANTFILKLDGSGSFQWAEKLGNDPFGTDQSVAVDLTGNVFVVWRKSIVKLNPNGIISWIKNTDWNVSDYSRSVAVDNNSNVYITGWFWNTVDFDPGPNIHNLTAFGSPFWQDSFVLRLDNNGNFIWVQQIGGNTTDFAFSIYTDLNGNIYHTGSFSNTADFDPGPNVYSLFSVGTSNYIHKMSRCTNITNSTITTTACNAYILNGQTYITSGVYTQIILNTAGCDSIITLNLTIGGSNTTSSITSCDSYAWQGQVYTISGYYSDTLVSSTNCDSILNLNLIIKNKVLSTVAITICQGQIYAGHSTSGTYIDTYIAANGCDSIRTLNLTVSPKLYSNITAIICDGQMYSGYTSSGLYIDTLVSVFGCDSIRTLDLTVNPRAFINISPSICEGQTYYAGGANQTTSGIYNDTLLTSLGCDSIITTTLTVHPKPKPDLGPDGNICLDANTKITPGVFNKYLWQDNSTQPDFLINTTGQYWVKVTGANNCTATDTLNVIAIDTIPKNFLPPDQQICYGSLLRLEVPGYIDYTWNDGFKGDYYNINKFGTYYLTVRDFNNCTGLDSISIKRKDCIPIGIPNAFTPNKDGLNDIFKPTINQAVQNFNFIVFNRYGQKVFETSEYGKGWDGTFKGKDQPAGSYVYRIKFINIFGWESVENGSVLLIR